MKVFKALLKRTIYGKNNLKEFLNSFYERIISPYIAAFKTNFLIYMLFSAESLN